MQIISNIEYMWSLYQVWKLVQDIQSYELCKMILASAYMLYHLSIIRLQLQKMTRVQESKF